MTLSICQPAWTPPHPGMAWLLMSATWPACGPGQTAGLWREVHLVLLGSSAWVCLRVLSSRTAKQGLLLCKGRREQHRGACGPLCSHPTCSHQPTLLQLQQRLQLWQLACQVWGTCRPSTSHQWVGSPLRDRVPWCPGHPSPGDQVGRSIQQCRQPRRQPPQRLWQACGVLPSGRCSSHHPCRPTLQRQWTASTMQAVPTCLHRQARSSSSSHHSSSRAQVVQVVHLLQAARSTSSSRVCPVGPLQAVVAQRGPHTWGLCLQCWRRSLPLGLVHSALQWEACLALRNPLCPQAASLTGPQACQEASYPCQAAARGRQVLGYPLRASRACPTTRDKTLQVLGP
jgi:hypothetical protein